MRYQTRAGQEQTNTHNEQSSKREPPPDANAPDANAPDANAPDANAEGEGDWLDEMARGAAPGLGVPPPATVSLAKVTV